MPIFTAWVRTSDVWCRKNSFPKVSCPVGLLWPWIEGLGFGGGRRVDMSPPKRSASEFAVFELNWVVVKTSIMGISGVVRVPAASTVTTCRQTGMTALVQQPLKSPWPESRWSCSSDDISSRLPCPGMSSSWYLLLQWSLDSEQRMLPQADRNASGSVAGGALVLC